MPFVSRSMPCPNRLPTSYTMHCHYVGPATFQAFCFASRGGSQTTLSTSSRKSLLVLVPPPIDIVHEYTIISWLVPIRPDELPAFGTSLSKRWPMVIYATGRSSHTIADKVVVQAVRLLLRKFSLNSSRRYAESFHRSFREAVSVEWRRLRITLALARASMAW